MTARKIPWLGFVVLLLGLLPLGSIGLMALTGEISVNPIQDIEQRLGRAALYFLVASLTITPVYTLTGWRGVLPHRRILGLFAFLYASLHFITFVAVDYGFDLREISLLVFEKPFILLGVAAGLMLLPLAITSFSFFIRKIGKGWKPLHRMVYIAIVLVIIHFTWAKKGDLLTLRGDILKPLSWGLVVLVLLILRIPVVRQSLNQLQQRMSRQGWFRNRDAK